MNFDKTLPYGEFVSLTQRYMDALAQAFACKGASTPQEKADRRAAWANFYQIERQLHDEIRTYHFLNPQ